MEKFLISNTSSDVLNNNNLSTTVSNITQDLSIELLDIDSKGSIDNFIDIFISAILNKNIKELLTTSDNVSLHL